MTKSEVSANPTGSIPPKSGKTAASSVDAGAPPSLSLVSARSLGSTRNWLSPLPYDFSIRARMRRNARAHDDISRRVGRGSHRAAANPKIGCLSQVAGGRRNRAREFAFVGRTYRQRCAIFPGGAHDPDTRSDL